jgi:hypothetical protein
MSEQDAALPTTVADAVARARAARAELESLISSLSEEQLTAPGPEKWSIKDHLAHLETWSRSLHDLLDGRPRYPRFGLSSPEELHTAGFDVINEWLYEKNKERSLDDVLAGFRESHQGTIDRLQTMSDADLCRPYTSYLAEDRPDGNEAIVNWIEGDSWGHDAEHLGWIREHFGM